jgi:hypothetical protein
MEQKEREQILIERKEWYSKIFVLFEICKLLKNRELCFLSQKGEPKKKAVRFMMAWSLDFLKKHFKWINFDKNLINMYHSVAKFKPNSFPIFDWDLRERTNEEKYIFFNKNYEQYVAGYNFFLDLDGKQDFEKCYAEAKEIKRIFDEYHLPYYILNSSFRGFHFHIPCEYLPNYPIKELLDVTYKVMYNLKGIYSLDTLDILNDLKRVCKVGYSYECSGAICLPLSDEQFNSFKPEMVSMKNVLKNVIIKNRGLLLRTHNLSFEQLKENVKKFINEFQ